MKWMRIAAAVGTVAALVGLAGAASASATIDLIWAETGTSEISDVGLSSTITLQVILTAGPNGSIGAGVSVDYGPTLGQLVSVNYGSTPGGPLPIALGITEDTGSRIENINSASLPPDVGTGLAAGESHQLGTVTFHRSLFATGIFEIPSDPNGPTDAVLDGQGRDITSTTTFNAATLISAYQTPVECDFVIEINALRGGSPTVSVNSTKDITAKARIAKGTAPQGTTIDTYLSIQAVDDGQVIDTQFSDLIRLGVGKGGKGDKLRMNVPQCVSGSIDFVATFVGQDDDGDQCSDRRTITKTCK